MAEQQTTQIVLVHLEYLRDKVDAIDGKLEAQNGRIRKTEEAVAVLNDRTDEARNAGRNWGLTAGGIGSAIGAALAYLFGGGVK